MNGRQHTKASDLVADEQWLWRAGILAYCSELRDAGYSNIRAAYDQEDEDDFSGWYGGSWGAKQFDMIPDLTDNATGGAIFALLPAEPEPLTTAIGQCWHTVELVNTGRDFQIVIEKHTRLAHAWQLFEEVSEIVAQGRGETFAEAAADAWLSWRKA